jgi:tripartite-type tricarboxylate transporter receptor subunit TctC
VIGIFGRSDTPPGVVQKIATEALAAVSDPAVIQQLAVVGVEPAGAGPEEFAGALQAETRRITEAVRAAGIKGK